MLGALLAQDSPDVSHADASIVEIAAVGAYLHGLAAGLAADCEQRGWSRRRCTGSITRSRHPRRTPHHRLRYRGGYPTGVRGGYPVVAGRLGGMSEQTPITDVVFDFCGVLLDWQTRACLEGVLPQVLRGLDLRRR